MTRPSTTEEAQYSTAFPVAVALRHGTVEAAHLHGAGLRDPGVLALADRMAFVESEAANAEFPARRRARARIETEDGRRLESGWHEARWEADAPPSDGEIEAKFDGLAGPVTCTG